MSTLRSPGHRINKIIIALLCLILLGVVLADLARRRHTKELTASINALNGPSQDISVLQQDISDLYEAENNFRLYAATYDKSYFSKYYNGLKKIQVSIASLRNNGEPLAEKPGDSASLDNAFERKIAINKKIVELKRSIDNALAAAMQLDTSKNVVWQLPYYKQSSYYKVPLQKTRRTDTLIISQKTSKKKGFFRRVQTAFSGTNDKDTVTVNRLSGSSIERDSALVMTRTAVRSVEDYYRRHLQEQWAARNMLNSKDRELVLLNFSLVDSLNHMLRDFQAQQKNEQDYHKNRSLGIARRSARELSLISLLSLVIIILLLLLILYNIYRVNGHARNLLIARQDAEKQTIAKSNLLASVSHEIRNPLTVIRGLTELLYHGNLPDPQQEQVRTIKSASDILLSTVNDILDFSKLEAGRMSIQPAPMQPSALAEEVYGIMKSLAEQKGLLLRLETKASTSGLTVRGDAFRLKQVLLNLTSNAIKFTEQGEVTIKVFDLPVLRAIARPDREPVKQALVTFEVADTGIGIPSDKIQDLFNEFEQIKPMNGGSPVGTGLGLAICKKLVQLHAGSIGVKSKPGKGSVFSVKIEFEVVQDVPPGSFKNKKILLVDDNPMIIQLAKLLLEKQEATVVIADDGACAWSLYRGRPFDMVITDINLPGISGIAMARNIRSLPDLQKARIPILALTGDALEQHIDTYTAAGFSDHIIKPFNKNDFLTKVQKYLSLPGLANYRSTDTTNP